MYKRIKSLRISNNYSIFEISNYLNITESLYISYENGSKEPSIKILSKLAKFYNTSIDYIVEETDVITPHKKI